MQSGHAPRPGFLAMVVTFVRWWRLWLASLQDQDATDPPPAFVSVAMREANWSAARVANFYERALSDAAAETATYRDRARVVETDRETARAQGYLEGYERGRNPPTPIPLSEIPRIGGRPLLPPVPPFPQFVIDYCERMGRDVPAEPATVPLRVVREA